MPQNPSSSSWRAITLTGTALAALYVLLYEANVLIMGSAAFGGVASLLFLPAFVRLLGFLLIRHWSIPALFISAWFCIHLNLDPAAQFIVAMALAIGAPITIGWVARAIDLEPTLANLNGKRLLILSTASALGSSSAYHLGLLLVGINTKLDWTLLAAIVGDITGTWTIIYIAKGSIHLIMRTIQPHL